MSHEVPTCPCWRCVHIRHMRPQRRSVWPVAIQAALVITGIVYLLLFEVPGIVAQLL